MEQGDVKSHFVDLTGGVTANQGNFYIPGGAEAMRLKGFWYVCVSTYRGRVEFQSRTESETILKVVVQGNLAAGCGIVTIPGNGIYSPSGIWVDVDDDDDSGGGMRSITVFYQT